jgi:UDP-N-acetylglucosamine enolpyruvyl transferase
VTTRNPADSTFRNIDALKRGFTRLAAKFAKLAAEVKAIKAVIGQQARER